MPIGECRRPVWFWLRVYRLGLTLQRWSGVNQVTVRLKVDASQYREAMDRAADALQGLARSITIGR